MTTFDFEQWWITAGKLGQAPTETAFRADQKAGKIPADVKMSRDELRKAAKELLAKHGINVKARAAAGGSNVERNFDNNFLEVTYLKNQLKIRDNEIKRLSDMAACDYTLVRMFEESLERFEPVPCIAPVDLKQKATSEEVVILLSDVHYGEVVSSAAMLDSNAYDTIIARERLNKWYNAIRSILNKLNGYNHKKINLFMLGDMVNGMIHEELKSGTCEVDQVLELSEIIANIILELSREFDIDVCGVVGNHGRMTKKPSFKKKYNNFDYLVYKFVAVRCQNLTNVTFNFPEAGMMIKEVNGYNFLLRHGDCKAQSFMGIPFYGIQRASSKITQTIAFLKDIFIHYEVLGHFHTTNVLEKVGGSVIMNGTLKGGDEFALESMLTSCEAKQTIFGVHKEHGKTWQFDVHCN